MASQVISINRKKYAVGLFWQPTGAGYVARSYAKTLAKSIDKKLNLFTEYRGMVGLGSKRAGHRAGMESAAAVVTDALSEYNSFLAVFFVDKVYFLVAVRNGIILEDKIFEREEDARAEYFKLSEIPDWGALFAPSAWGMPRAVERNLSDLVVNTAKVILHPISRFGTGVFSIFLIALFVFGFSYLFREPIKQMLAPRVEVSEINPDLAEEYKKQIEENNKVLDEEFDIEKPKPPEPIVLPYDNLPLPMDRAEVCYQAMAFLMQPVPGWNQTSVECGETHATARFVRDFGTLGDFYEYAGTIMPGSFVQEESQDSLIVRATLPQSPVEASLDERDPETVLRAVMTAFQSINTSVDADIVVDALTNGVETKYLNIVEVAAESKLVPMQFIQIFNEFGGVYMTRCTWNASSRTWNYEVIIYAK